MKITPSDIGPKGQKLSFGSHTILLRQLLVCSFRDVDGFGSVGAWLYKFMEVGAAPSLGARLEGPLGTLRPIGSIELLTQITVDKDTVDFVVTLSHDIDGLRAKTKEMAYQRTDERAADAFFTWKFWSALDATPKGIGVGHDWIRNPRDCREALNSNASGGK